MRGVDYLSSFSSSGNYEQTKSLLELGKQHIYSDRVGSAPQPRRVEQSNTYQYDDYANPYSRNRDDENKPPDEPFSEDNNNNWAPPEPETPSAMELGIETLEQELTQLAEQNWNVNAANHHKPHDVAELQLYKPMVHSVAPSPSNITFYPRILPPPNLAHSTTVVLVISEQSNFRKRQAIRETWARGHDNVYFIVGHSNCHENMEIQMVDRTHCREKDNAFLVQEQLRSRDLIEVPMIEYYRGVPEKVVQAYQWSLTHLPHVRWLVKADDDIFVRVQSVERYLQKFNSYIPMLIGRIIMESPVNREGKWTEQEDYPYVYYPYWPQGSTGHIMSRPTAEYIVDNSPKLRRYQGEDVSIGIWLDEAKEKGGNALTNLQYIHVPRLVQNEGKGHCQEGTYLMIGHDMKPRDLEQCMKWNDELPPIRAWMDDSAEFEPPNRIKFTEDAYNGNAKEASQSNAANFRNIFGVSDQERRARLRQAIGGGGEEAASNRWFTFMSRWSR